MIFLRYLFLKFLIYLIHKVIAVIIIIIIVVITFMQGIHNYIPETNHVYRVCNVAAVLYLQFLLHIKLFRP